MSNLIYSEISDYYKYPDNINNCRYNINNNQNN